MKTLELVDFVLKECQVAEDYGDVAAIPDCAIALISENSQELLVATASAAGAVTFLFSHGLHDDEYPGIGFRISDLAWRISNGKN